MGADDKKDKLKILQVSNISFYFLQNEWKHMMDYPALRLLIRFFKNQFDPNLEKLGLPSYPPLPGNTDHAKVEEIRRTVYVGNLPKGKRRRRKKRRKMIWTKELFVKDCLKRQQLAVGRMDLVVIWKWTEIKKRQAKLKMSERGGTAIATRNEYSLNLNSFLLL
uniref:Uncharacterized protein n=1 Tax=Heterorhabditis bacteriophora TaxID=37862 RepID=A0A1I7X5C7_HETBA